MKLVSNRFALEISPRVMAVEAHFAQVRTDFGILLAPTVPPLAPGLKQFD
jgi:hypothetical protein